MIIPKMISQLLKISLSKDEKNPTIRVVFWKIGVSINLFWAK